jgi:spermidine synthase
MLKLLEKFFNGFTVLDITNSKFNGPIQIQEDLFGNKHLIVGSLTQSGKEVENLWQKAVEQLSNLTINNCLILGLGAGNAAKIINKYFSNAKITGVEIDPEIIRLGRKYFGLNKIKNLEILICDAISFISETCRNAVIHKSSFINHYNLVLVDLYLGDSFPKKAEESKFLESISKILKPKGTVIFNRLYYGNHKEITDKFEQKIRKVFSQVEAKTTDYNKLFLCRK